MRQLMVALLIIPSFGYTQPLKIKNNYSGIFSLGIRSTVSAFNGGEHSNNGFGFGAQYRIQFADRINTDWFFDYITTDISDYVNRKDYHIGWSVIYYFTDKPNPVIKPYILAGHCFDYTVLQSNKDASNNSNRLSSAIQAGGGLHFNLSERLDLSFVSQYMIHLGQDIHAYRNTNGSVSFKEEKGSGLEGHLLIHVGINYKIADLW
jgi:hypothetical protein